MRTIDCRGLNCPEPVLRTKHALTENPFADFNIVVDNKSARENVLRFVRSNGRKSEWQEVNGSFHISVAGSKAKSDASDLVEINLEQDNNNVLLFISTDQLGQGSTELGRILMRNFIYTLTKRDNLPQAIILMNSGVRLSIKESPVIEELANLQARGVLILVCGTCLDYYELQEQQQAGQVSNMYDITDLLFAARMVITI
jgi:selenium metabolism protein YedF